MSDKPLHRIGLIDSGMGGLSVLKDISISLGDSEYVYYGDLHNSPYGGKTPEQVIKFTTEAVEYLLTLEVNAVLVACNTATSVSIKTLREKYPIPIFGMEPAIKPALLENPGKRIAVLATPLTLKEEKLNMLEKSLNAEELIIRVECEGLATLIDKGEMKQAEEFLKPKLESIISDGVDIIVLGCTHYVFLKRFINIFYPKLKVYDGNSGTVAHIKSSLQIEGDPESESKLDLYFNGGSEIDFDIAQKYLNSNYEEPLSVK
ncbi:MAG: glutamate racemase [Leptospira sp.]|nr:glutamate racemase [Leptospira sp.]